MSIAGRDVYDEIQEKIEDLETERRRHTSAIDSIEAKLGSLSEQREQLYDKLARHYLPTLDAAAVAKTLHEVRDDVQAIFAKKGLRRADLAETLDVLTQTRHKIDLETAGLDKQMIEKEAALREARKVVRDTLAADTTYVAKDKQAQGLKAGIEAKFERCKRFIDETKPALTKFNGDPLFSYLLRQGYGTDQYKSTGIVAVLDKWVARVSHFGLNNQKYVVLTRGPELMRQEVEKDKAGYDALRVELRGMEEKVMSANGIPATCAELEALEEDKKKRRWQLDDVVKKYAASAAELATLDTTKDTYHVQAIQKLKGYLKGETIQELRTRAKQTPGPEDDIAVDRIERIDMDVRTLKDEAKVVQSKLADVSQKLSGLSGISQHFSNNRYDSRKVYFDSDFDSGRLLTAFLMGQASASSVTRELDSSHHVREDPAPSYTSNYSSSSSSSSSVDFGSSSVFSSGGGFDGGSSFSTGGGF